MKISLDKQMAIGFTLLTLFFLQGELKATSDKISFIFFLIPAVLTWVWILLKKNRLASQSLYYYLWFQIVGSVLLFVYYVLSELVFKSNNGAPLFLYIVFILFYAALATASIWLSLQLQKLIRQETTI